MMEAHVYLALKISVQTPHARTIKNAPHKIGYANVITVR